MLHRIDPFSDADTMSAAPTFLFVTKADSTMVLQMGSEISELEREASEFCTKFPTLLCANVAGNRHILQVTCTSCFVYTDCSADAGATLLSTFDLLPHLDSKIKSVNACDPYVGILTHKGSLLCLRFDADTNALVLLESELNLGTVVSKIHSSSSISVSCGHTLESEK